HVLKRRSPNLGVVGEHESLRNAFSKAGQNPFSKISGFSCFPICRSRRSTQDTFDLNRLRKISQVILQRIRDPRLSAYDPTFTDQLVLFAAQHSIDELI